LAIGMDLAGDLDSIKMVDFMQTTLAKEYGFRADAKIGVAINELGTYVLHYVAPGT